MSQFNAKFTSYEGRNDITIYEILTVASYANENNEYYKDGDSNYLIQVICNNINVANSAGVNRLKGEIKTQQQSGLKSYKCSGISYNKNGRVNKITFKQ